MKLIEKLIKLYGSSSGALTQLKINCYGQNIEEKLKEFKENPPGNLKFNTLDNYEYKDFLAKLFGSLPAEKVYENFGEKILFWTALKTYYERTNDSACYGIENVFHGKEKDIENMRLCLWQRFWNSKSEDSFNLWKVYHKIDKNFTENYNLIGNLKNNLRKDCKISEEKLNKYFLEPLKIKSNSVWKAEKWYRTFLNENEGYSIHLESPASIGLMKNNEPCAFVSFIPTSSKTLLINAFQGVNKRIFGGEIALERKVIKTIPQTGLSPFYWKKVLFDVSFEFAKENNFSKIGVQSGYNNMWTKPYKHDGKIHLPLEKALKIYDEFAESIGMKQGKDKNWYMGID
jgi:hypothetical protein